MPTKKVTVRLGLTVWQGAVTFEGALNSCQLPTNNNVSGALGSKALGTRFDDLMESF